ncbi:hypothetical protein ACXYTJ_10560 [Gilvimarinus sp. F26214L]|uniref:hypothetical protein n=1 Tax=Gilvimarinus sp. DZF01 TaxID=3461371 RepID=UPI004045A310
MSLYVVAAFWLGALAFSLLEGKRKLPLLSFVTGLATLWLAHNGGQELVALSILSALAVIALLGSKVGSIKAS